METVIAKKTNDFLTPCLNMASDMLRMPSKQIWIDYDEGADVIYMSFRRPQRATETIEVNGDILLRKAGEDVVGLTILNASYNPAVKK